MNTDLEQAAQRMHLLLYQLQSSVVAGSAGNDYETVVKTAAAVLREEMQKIDDRGGDAALALMMVFLSEGVLV